jgi:hypothetical protein
MNFLKWIRVCSTQRVSQEGAVDSTRKTIIPTHWLINKITVEEAEADNPGISDDRVARWRRPAQPKYNSGIVAAEPRFKLITLGRA